MYVFFLALSFFIMVCLLIKSIKILYRRFFIFIFRTFSMLVYKLQNTFKAQYCLYSNELLQ
jgi:hypothetical protein